MFYFLLLKKKGITKLRDYKTVNAVKMKYITVKNLVIKSLIIIMFLINQLDQKCITQIKQNCKKPSIFGEEHAFNGDKQEDPHRQSISLVSLFFFSF